MKITSHWLHQPNPLTLWWPKFKTFGELAKALRFNPLKGLKIDELSVLERLELLAMEKMPLLATPQLVQISATVLGMIHGSLSLRNPTTAAGRALVEQAMGIGLSPDYSGFPAPVPSSCCLLVVGITGTSKSTILTHTLRLLGAQVRRLGACDAAGYLSATHLVYLVVPMSHDGSRGGFVTNILLAIDRALHTHYAIEIPSQFRTIERQVGAAISLMHSLYVGALIVEEGQERNMVTSAQSPEMQLLILSLCNSGIPCIFVGNPLAYGWLSTFAQDASRFAKLTCGHLHPCGALCAATWKGLLGTPSPSASVLSAEQEASEDWRIISRGVMSYRVMLVDDEEACSMTLLECSGGIPGPALGLWCDGQTDALLRGEEKVTSEHIGKAFEKEGFNQLRSLTRGFAIREPEMLMAYRDVPAEFYARVWKKPLPHPLSSDYPQHGAKSKTGSGGSKKSRSRSDAEKFKASQTRRAIQDQKRAEARKNLPKDSLRIQGLVGLNLASFDRLIQEFPMEQDH